MKRLHIPMAGRRQSPLIQRKVGRHRPTAFCLIMWQPISTAPFHCDLELAVIEGDDIHALIFPCRRQRDGVWIDSKTKTVVDVKPSHWRDWMDGSEVKKL